MQWRNKRDIAAEASAESRSASSCGSRGGGVGPDALSAVASSGGSDRCAQRGVSLADASDVAVVDSCDAAVRVSSGWGDCLIGISRGGVTGFRAGFTRARVNGRGRRVTCRASAGSGVVAEPILSFSRNRLTTEGSEMPARRMAVVGRKPASDASRLMTSFNV